MHNSKRQRIAVDARWIFTELSGIGRCTLELLARLGRWGEECDFVVLVQNDERRSYVQTAAGLAGKPNFSFEIVPYGPFSLRGQWAVARLLYEKGVDIYHSTNFMIPLPAFPRQRPHAVQCLCTIHDLIPLIHPEYTPRSLKTRLLPVYRALMREIARRTDHVVAVSESSRIDIEQWLDIPAERISVVYNGIPAGYRPVGGRPSMAGEAKTVLYVGRSDPYKNLPGLVRAFAKLREDHPELDVRLKIAGSPDRRYPEAGRLARELAVADRVDWMGYVDDAALLKAYQQADVLALLSRYEGFGLPVMEAMACGTPVVCSDVTSLPEIAGGAALLVPPDDTQAAADALYAVLADDYTASRLRMAGLQRTERFSWDQAAQAILQLYRRLSP